VVRDTDAALAGYQAARDAASLGLFEVTDRVASFEWDVEEAKEQHKLLARHMASEVEMLGALDGPPASAAPPLQRADVVGALELAS
jgi:hypothetical protein